MIWADDRYRYAKAFRVDKLGVRGVEDTRLEVSDFLQQSCSHSQPLRIVDPRVILKEART